MCRSKQILALFFCTVLILSLSGCAELMQFHKSELNDPFHQEFKKIENASAVRDDCYLAKSSKTGQYVIVIGELLVFFENYVTNVSIVRNFSYKGKEYIIYKHNNKGCPAVVYRTLNVTDKPKESKHAFLMSTFSDTKNEFVTFETPEGLAIMRESETPGTFYAWKLTGNYDITKPIVINSKKHKKSGAREPRNATSGRKNSAKHSGNAATSVSPEIIKDVEYEFNKQNTKAAPRKSDKLTLILDD